MNTSIFLPDIDLKSINLIPEHEKWLKEWLLNLEQEIENEQICSSNCLQGAISELVLYREINTDWLGNMDSYLLTSEKEPLAYSEKYGKRLYQFNHWKQTSVHCIHARWWIENILNNTSNSVNYSQLIQDFIQPNGWIYNPQISNTEPKYRMKSEYLMSLAMGIEILDSFNNINNNLKIQFESTLASENLSNFLSAEYFRIKALEILKSTHQAPVNIEQTIQLCEVKNTHGYCDFSVSEKRDEHMGTKTRTTRDVEVHSPMSSLQALYISNFCNATVKQQIETRLNDYKEHLKNKPMDIRAFRIRDLVNIPFGADLTPLEIIAASYFINHIINKDV